MVDEERNHALWCLLVVERGHMYHAVVVVCPPRWRGASCLNLLAIWRHLMRIVIAEEDRCVDFETIDAAA